MRSEPAGDSGHRYTHGHHRERPALAPVADGRELGRLPPPPPDPRPGPARRRLRARHHHRGPGPPGRAGPGRRAWTGPRRPSRRRPHSTTRAWPSRSRPATSTQWSSTTPPSTSSTPTRSSSTSTTRWRRCGEMARVCRADGVVAVRDGDYESMTWYPAVPRARPVARPLPTHRPGQRRRPRRRTAARRVGAGGRLHRRRGDRVGLVLRDARRPPVVGRDVGRADHRDGAGRPHPRARPGRPRRARRDRPGLAVVGRPARRLVLGHPRRGAVPPGLIRLAPSPRRGPA